MYKILLHSNTYLKKYILFHTITALDTAISTLANCYNMKIRFKLKLIPPWLG